MRRLPMIVFLALLPLAVSGCSFPWFWKKPAIIIPKEEVYVPEIPSDWQPWAGETVTMKIAPDFVGPGPVWEDKKIKGTLRITYETITATPTFADALQSWVNATSTAPVLFISSSQYRSFYKIERRLAKEYDIIYAKPVDENGRTLVLWLTASGRDDESARALEKMTDTIEINN
ncbi:MAG: hypothetical protein Q8L21_03450 [Candidatus Komeilibacteria bacterium]|nr:hypothetical protein [Candidatus Komeilibacteria bacterium]